MLQILVNIGSVNGLLPKGTNPWPEPMLIYHQLNPQDMMSQNSVIIYSGDGLAPNRQ